MLYRILSVLGYKEGGNIESSEEVWASGLIVRVSKEHCLAQKTIYPGTAEVPPTAGFTSELGQCAYLFARTSVLIQWNFASAKSLWLFCILLLVSRSNE